MTPAEAKTLKVGSRIKWSDGSLGTVVDTNWHALMIKWDDGAEAIYQFNNNEPQWKAMTLTKEARPHV